MHNGRCHGYFGVTPSLLRIPFLPLLNAVDRGATSIYMTGALTLAVGSALGILSRLLANVRRTPLLIYLAGALAVTIGPASVLTMIARLAILWRDDVPGASSPTASSATPPVRRGRGCHRGPDAGAVGRSPVGPPGVMLVGATVIVALSLLADLGV
ncbi:MAG: hypothetical protein ACR2JH_09585 [Solirubrobacteraceae bacterium]